MARTGVMHTECIRDARREEKQRSDLMMESLRKSSVAILSGTQEELNVLAATLEDTVVHSVMATQGVIAILSATETQAAAREIWDRRGGSFAEEQSAPAANLIAGRNPVIEAIKSGREIEKIYMAAGAEGSVVKIRAMAKDAGIVVDTVPRVVLDRMAPGEKHQGVAAEISAYSYSTFEDIMERAADSDEPPFIMVLDEISDPHNLGAIIRTAECANAHGVIIPKRNACGLTSTVAKTSAGALERMPVARVTNISRTIEELQAQGVWVAAVDMDGKSFYETEGVMKGAIALVIGNEGKGISRLVKEKCDLTISIPMKGSINSLNASNAAAIMMYAVRRSRDF